MKLLLYVFLGGGLGSILRFGFSKYLNPLVSSFPMGTFSANIIACLLLGMLSGYAFRENSNSDVVKYFLVIGLCGGFSTFSTFAFEIQHIMKEGFLLGSISYLLFSLLAGVLSVFLGIWIFR